MAITHSTAIRNTLANAVVDAIDVGSTNPAGQLVLMATGDVEVATLPMANPAYASAISGTANSNPITDDTNATGGTLALFAVQDRDGTEIFRGTVTGTGGGGDIEASNVSVTAGETVECSALNYSAPA